MFLLAFFGFGAKAGMMPLHSWLPRAHPAAPSHASALMSGVMVKIGIFGILKVAMDLLAQTGLPLWWGTLVMAIGAISALLGVLYALAEQDIKRLLAWSTVENVGIILLAVGVAMDGLSLHDPLLTVVGLLGALFHLLNHALFKGLLFLGAGAIISRLHTHDMEKMGALAKRMPWTAAACLIGCLAISAIPPLNGFISEWYTWQSLFSLSRVEAVALQLAGPIAMVMLAVTGGLAVMCFVKMYGITFCGAPRSTHAEEAQEVPNTMIVAMLLLAALCVLIALSASWLAPKIMHIAHAFTNTPPVTVASGIALVPGTFHTRVTPSLLLLLLLAMPLLPGLYWLWCRSRRAAFRRTGDAWACGYGWENAMAPSGNGVMQPLRVVFSALFRLRQQLDPTLRLNKGFAHVTARAQSTEPFWDERLTLGILVEPMLILSLLVLALIAGSTHIEMISNTLAMGWNSPLTTVLALLACGFACFIEMGKIPFDVAEAEQELQEGPLTEYSGAGLALAKWGLGLKQVVMAALFVALFLPFGRAQELSLACLLTSLVVTLLKVLLIFVLASIAENTLARGRFLLIHHVTWLGFSLAALAWVFWLTGL
ncbi:TPA: NADH-quinone oxidoreductase subunit H [Escherichia coli]|nr:NADH-quinone oxidoreductase subunit H [Escherichia coli]